MLASAIETVKASVPSTRLSSTASKLSVAVALPAARFSEQRSAAVAGLLEHTASVPVQNLIQLLLRRGRIEQLPRVAAEFRRLDDRRQGITHATATSATALTPDEVRALTARLEQSTGGRVELHVEVLGDQGDDLINGQISTDTLAGGQGDDTIIAAAAGEIDETFVLSTALLSALNAL